MQQPRVALLTLINLLAGAAFVWTKSADRLWASIEPALPWRTGPAWSATFVYFALIAGGWMLLNLVATRALQLHIGVESLVLRAAKFLVAACAIVVLQVLMPHGWLMATGALLLLVALLSLQQRRVPQVALEWACLFAGIWIAKHLIHPYFVGTPLFIPRLALTLTASRPLGSLLGIAPTIEWTPDWLVPFTAPAASVAPPTTSA